MTDIRQSSRESPPPWRFVFRRRLRAISNLRANLWGRLERMRHRSVNVKDIASFERRVFSQNGEDGIIYELFRRIGTTNRYFVEFGVEDGLECNSAQLARCANWNGLFIEGNRASFNRLQRNYAGLSNLRFAHHFVTRENIVQIFRAHGVPQEPDLLSIDIDGNDYWVWQSLEEFRPRVVVIEYNAMYPPPARWIMSYNPGHAWDGTSYHGASLTSLTELAHAKQYSLVGTDSHGVNAFFVQNTLLVQLGLPSLSPEAAYHPPNFGILYKHHPYRSGPAVTSENARIDS